MLKILYSWQLMELHLIAMECHLPYGITVLPATCGNGQKDFG